MLLQLHVLDFESNDVLTEGSVERGFAHMIAVAVSKHALLFYRLILDSQFRQICFQSHFAISFYLQIGGDILDVKNVRQNVGARRKLGTGGNPFIKSPKGDGEVKAFVL